MQMLEIDWGLGADAPKIFCPVCGELEDPENTDYCTHVTFVYLPGYDEFDYVADSFTTVVDELRSTHDAQSDEDDATVLALLEKLPSTGTNFILQLSSGGMACGPTGFTAIYGFNLANGAEQ